MGDLDIDRRQGSFSAEEVELNQITLTISDVDQVVPTAGVIRESLQGTQVGQRLFGWGAHAKPRSREERSEGC